MLSALALSHEILTFSSLVRGTRRCKSMTLPLETTGTHVCCYYMHGVHVHTPWIVRSHIDYRELEI